jgi:hypothetical protein
MTPEQLLQAERQRAAQIPEISTQGIQSVAPEAGLGTAMAAITTTDSAIRPKDETGAFVPSELSQMLKEVSPDMEILHTPEGEERAFNPDTKRIVSLNKPDMSLIDVMRALGITAAFAPTGKVAAGGTTLGSKMLAGGATGFGTQAGIETVQEATGGEFDPGDIGLAATVGGALPVAVQGVKGAVRGVSNVLSRLRGQENEAVARILSQQSVPKMEQNLVRGIQLNDTDETAKQVIKLANKRGIEDSAAKTIYGSNNADKQALRSVMETTRLVKEYDVLKATRNRLTPIGETVMKRWDKVVAKNAEAGEQLSDIAVRDFDGVEVDVTLFKDQFNDILDGLGARVSDKGKLLFEDSSVKEIPAARKMLQSAWNVVQGTKGDALKLHRAKQIMDEVVTYNSQLNGISGKSELAVRSLRSNINDVLRDISEDYAQINDQYSTTIKALDAFRDATGRHFNPKDHRKASTDLVGYIARGVTEDTPVEQRFAAAFDGLEQTAVDLGEEFVDDLRTQAVFNKELEKALKMKYKPLTEELLDAGPLETARFFRGDRASVIGDLIGRFLRALGLGKPDEKALNALERLVK